jgi:acetylornithine/N-succinyldiaminopimelate aminotransferase
MSIKDRKLSDSQELFQKYIMQNVKRIPVTFVKGKGVRLWDEDGNEYLDFVGGWATTSLGHCHPVVARAAAHQSRTLIQVSNAYYNLPAAHFAEMLVKNSCLDQVFFCNSGAEANESAVKLARRYGSLKLNGAYEIITMKKSFHGRTLMMTAATAQDNFQSPYAPLPSGFVHVDHNDIEGVKKATNEKTCAVMIEPVQGEGGVNLPEPDYLLKLRKWCDEKGILLIFDEVQTGLCRTGRLFGYQYFNVEPDMMTLAKGLASGMAIGALLAKEETCVFAPGEHGTTFGGNPFACAVGLAVLKYMLEKDIAGNTEKCGVHMMNKLNDLKKKYNVISDVRGTGLLIAMQLKKNIAEEIMYGCMEKGLLLNMLKPDLIRFMPPLIIRKSEIDEGIKIIDEVLSGMSF